MDLSSLPDDLVELVERYVPSYKNYKKEEADNIRWYAMSTEYILYERNLLHKDVKDWSLYGQLWLATAPEESVFRDPIQPSEAMTPQEWYQHRIQRLNR
jgi:hypothetical protein